MPKRSNASPSARIGPSRARKWWLILSSWVGDHLWLSLLTGALLCGALLFYGIPLNGFAHLSEALSRWRMEVFGGTFRVERSIELPDVILSFHDENFDRVDALVGSAGFMGGMAFRKEIAVLAGRPGARIRVVAFDPRLGNPRHPRHAEFDAEAAGFGLKPWEYADRCHYSAAVLLHLLEDFAPALEVRFLDAPLPGASAPFFIPGRSVQLYRGDDPATRLDILVPRPSEADGMDSASHPALIIRHRPNDPEVDRFEGIFADAWNRGKPFDKMLQAEILKLLSPLP